MRRGAFFLLVALGLAPSLSTAAADLQPSVSVTAPGAKASCLPMPDDRDAGESCVIAEFGEVGAVDNHRFHFAVYQYHNLSSSALNHTRVVVFEAPAPGTMRAVVATESDPAIGYDKPRILRSGDRVLLHIPGREAGTGNFNRERLYMWRAGQWREVDTTSWLDDLTRRLPAGYGAWKGIYPDYRTLKASTPLWRKGDGNACPTGGRADLVLGLHDDRIVLRGLRHRRTAECS